MIEKTHSLLDGIFAGIFILTIIPMVALFMKYDFEMSIDIAYFLAGLLILMHYEPAIRARFLLKRRPAEIDKLIKSMEAEKRAIPSFALSDNLLELGRRDSKFSAVIQKNDWQYGDYSYAVYKKTKNGEYKASTIYYSVVRLELPRELPNLLFDSPRTHGHQFKRTFDNSQSHNLEGSFDKYFTTYFPKFYSIDALSIITPEVMEALIEAKDFDVEISGNGLYLYRPLLPVKDIPQMIDKARAVKNKLMNNIMTYRDERIDMEKGREATSKFGSRLRKNPYRAKWTVAIGIIATVAGTIFAYYTGNILNVGVLYGAITLFFGLLDMFTIMSDNRSLDAQYSGLIKSKAAPKNK